MFGYRINFSKKQMKTKAPDPQASQAHKPVSKFVADIMNLLAKDYIQIPKHHSKQRILVPVHDSDSEEEEPEMPDSPASLQSPKSPKRDENSDDDQAEDMEAQSPNVFEGTDNALKKKLNRTSKHKGELVTIKLRNGDRQTYRKRCKNLYWKVAPIERVGSAVSNARRTL